MNRRSLVCMLLAGFSGCTAFLVAFSIGPVPQLTGGFGEITCVTCHFGHELNEGRLLGGNFHIEGVPRIYNPGTAYPITVTISHPGQKRWGFQLSTRFEGVGTQAGELQPVDEMTQIEQAGGIQYIEHTPGGTRLGTAHGPVQFVFNWIAPQDAAGPVIFNAAGNAADGSGDPTGDFVYTAGAYSGSAAVAPAVGPRTGAAVPERRFERINNSSRFMHIPAPVNLNRGDVEIHIEHRFLQPLTQASPGTAFGVDAGANINLGVNYALSDRLSVGASRARFNKIITYNATLELLNKPGAPWQMSLHGGVEGQSNFERHYSPYLQLANTFDYDRLRVHVTPGMIFNSRNDEELPFFPIVNNPQHNHTFSLGLGADLALTRSFSLVGEVVPRLFGFGGFGPEFPATSGGVQIRSWGHVFTIMTSTSRTFTPSQYGVNAERDVSLGFNIYRRIR